MTKSRESRSRVYERLLRPCRPYRLPDPFAYLTPDESVVREPDDVPSAWDELTAEFAADELVAAGVAERGEGGEPAPVAAWADPAAVLVALRDPGEGHVLDLLTDTGSLSGELPALAVLRDGFTRDAAERNEGTVLAAFDLADVALLRACGFAATPATGLDDLAPERVGRLAANFVDWRCREVACDAWSAIDSSGGSAPLSGSVEGEVRRLVFVGWTPSRLDLEPPVELRTVARHVGELERFVGLDACAIECWRPTSETVARLRYLARHGDVRRTREALLDSLLDSSGGLLVEHVSAHRRVAGQPGDLAEALVRFHGTGTGPRRRTTDELRRTGAEVAGGLDSQVIAPMRDQALSASDPVERSLRLQQVELSRAAHLRTLHVNRALGDIVADVGATPENLPEREIGTLLAMTDRVIGLSREINRCHRTPATIEVVPTPAGHLGNSAGSA